MDSESQKNQLGAVAVLVAVVIAVGLVGLLEQSLIVSDASRYLVVTVVEWVGLSAQDLGHAVIIEGVTLPWSEDCSGINALTLLLVLCIWMHKDSLLSWQAMLRIAMCIPLALVVNLARVLTIALYRHVFYPDWETPQLHYFIGFLWLVPCIPFLVSSARGKTAAFWLNTAYLAIVLSLVAPATFNPGGLILVTCTLLYLLDNTFTPLKGRANLVYFPWIVGGLIIGASYSESLWLPWLLLAPGFVSAARLRSFVSWVVLSGTVSIIAMTSQAQPILLVAAAWMFGQFIRARESSSAAPSLSIRPVTAFGIGILLALPFTVPAWLDRNHEVSPPPAGVMSRKVAFNSYQIQSIGQAPDVAAFWFGPFGDGRHHSLVSCMKFRGVTLEEVDSSNGVYAGEGKWMAEFFIHEGRLLRSYHEYLISSLIPFSSAGIHIILEAPDDAMSAGYFRQASARVVESTMNYLEVAADTNDLHWFALE
ncbi:MAG: exosortase/archaeosortase family protein [Candidatus Azotimanducaceae bacterium]|jgi:exosortase/archaeosortase family protein